jgi:hypothetical protein
MIQRDNQTLQHEPIYKIDLSKDYNHRINEYSPYSQIIAMIPIDIDTKYECELIRECKNEFELRNDIDNEYFEGDELDMIIVFNDYVSDHCPQR